MKLEFGPAVETFRNEFIAFLNEHLADGAKAAAQRLLGLPRPASSRS